MRSHDDMVDTARQLAPLIRAAAGSAERARQPDDGVIAEARAGGLFELMSPARWGGSELDLDTYFEVGLILGEADASHGWVLDFYIEHVWMFTQFPEAFQKELFDGRAYVLAPAMISPSGTATVVPGGYELSGRWQWATGIVHGDWVIAGAVVTRDETPEAMFFALPRDQVTVEDTWYMDGMCATGSHDVVIAGSVVPVERAISIREMMGGRAPGAALHGGPLYSTPMAPILSFAAAIPVLATARACVREFASQLLGRYDMITLEAQSTRSSRQTRLAEADLDIRAAELLMRNVLGEVMSYRATADRARRVGWVASIAHAVMMSQRAVGLLGEAAGASSHRLDNPLQRARRDVNTMACHMVFDIDERRRSHGRSLLGLSPDSTWF